MARGKRKMYPPEWIIWEEFLHESSDHFRFVMKAFGASYLDHTDDTLVLLTERTAADLGDGTEHKRRIDEFWRRLEEAGFSKFRMVESLSDWLVDADFLRGRKWRALRYATLVAQGNWCRCCGNRPPRVQLHVDHIVPRSVQPSLALQLSNLQVLCDDCNLGKGASDSTDWRAESTA